MHAPDALLLSRLQSGDERAVAELADTFGPRIYALAFRYLRNREDAEEVTQDVLFKVSRKVADFRGDAALSSWIYRITFNAAMSRLRSLPARQDRQQADATPAMHGSDGEPIEARPAADVADWSRLSNSASGACMRSSSGV